MEKICSFFASDYHFEMISLPYINKQMKENKEVIIVTENNLENTVQKLLDNLNINNEDKQNIMNLNWKNNNFYKFQEIKELNKKEEDTIVFIKGNKNYIKNINENIENLNIKNNVKLVNCFDVNEVKDEMEDILKNYSKILQTSGEEIIL